MIREELKNLIRKAVKELLKEEVHFSFVVEMPDNKACGDYSTNVAMVAYRFMAEATGSHVPGGRKDKDSIQWRSHKVGKLLPNPLALAEELKNKIQNEKYSIVERVEVAGPGFINFFISKEYLQKQVEVILKEKEKYGQLKIGKGKRVNVEFISANPTGPLTIGNSRGGIIGDVLANILTKANWKVTREYYFNDAGGQIDILGHSILKDELAQYKGAYIDKLSKQIKSDNAREVGKKAAQIIIKEIKKTTQKMGIKFDVWTAEGKDLREKGKVEEIIKWLKEKDLTYEKEEALWFKSAQFGDDKDRVLVKGNGEPTYFALDCAYHKNKFVERKFDKVINIWGADHYGDLARVKGFVDALGYGNKFDILIQQFVRIIQDGKEVRMSKRTGTYITVDELIDEVGLDVTRFFFLMRGADTHLNFDLDLAKEQSEKNPVYYIQYAYARICSILAKYESAEILSLSARKLGLLKHESELGLIKELIRLPEVVEDTANDYQIQRLTRYSMDLATAFHRFYRDCKVISENKELTEARVALIQATRIVLKNTLDLMGISAPQKM